VQRRHWQLLVLGLTFVAAAGLGRFTYLATKPAAVAAPTHGYALQPGDDTLSELAADYVNVAEVRHDAQAMTLSIRVVPEARVTLDELFVVAPTNPSAHDLRIDALPLSRSMSEATLVLRDAHGEVLQRVDLREGAASARLALAPGAIVRGGLEVGLAAGPSSGLPFTTEIRISEG